MEEKNEIEKAKELIEKDRQERAEAFKKELDALCEKYRCRLENGGIIINAV